MRTINDLLGYIDAPRELREKVQDYYDFKFANKEGSSSFAKSMEEMPASLKVALVKHRYGDLLARVPFFASLHGRSDMFHCQLNSDLLNFSIAVVELVP